MWRRLTRFRQNSITPTPGQYAVFAKPARVNAPNTTAPSGISAIETQPNSLYNPPQHNAHSHCKEPPRSPPGLATDSQQLPTNEHAQIAVTLVLQGASPVDNHKSFLKLSGHLKSHHTLLLTTGGKMTPSYFFSVSKH